MRQNQNFINGCVSKIIDEMSIFTEVKSLADAYLLGDKIHLVRLLVKR